MNASRPLCVLVHGWGMNHAVWQPVIEALSSRIDFMALDLPGHGHRAGKSFTDLDDLVAALRDDVARPAVWVGWSLGGLATLKLALDFPQQVRSLMLVASTPCFMQRPDWFCGMAAEVFDGFSRELEADFPATIKRFLSLQVKDSAQGRQLLKQLRQQVLQQSAPDRQALLAGLNILKTTDLRASLKKLNIPLAVALGERDGLVSAGNAGFFADNNPGADVQVYARAAHAPFLSHLPEFVAQLQRLVDATHD